MDKTELRNRYIELRGDLSPEFISSAEKAIIESVETCVDWRIIRKVHIYGSVALWNEVPTYGIINLIQTNWSHVEIIIGDADRSSIMPVSKQDVIFVPLLAFDKKLNRIGFGGGWYDRFLASQTSAYKIGLAYDIQFCAKVPIQSHDIPMDCIITESQILTK